MENHNTGTINSSARYCLVKPGDKVRITKTHRAGIHQFVFCVGFLFIIFFYIVQNNSGQMPARLITDKAGRSFRQLKIPIAREAFDFSHIGGKMGIYTDLAAELRDINPDIEGIREDETNDGEI